MPETSCTATFSAASQGNLPARTQRLTCTARHSGSSGTSGPSPGRPQRAARHSSARGALVAAGPGVAPLRASAAAGYMCQRWGRRPGVRFARWAGATTASAPAGFGERRSSLVASSCWRPLRFGCGRAAGWERGGALQAGPPLHHDLDPRRLAEVGQVRLVAIPAVPGRPSLVGRDPGEDGGADRAGAPERERDARHPRALIRARAGRSAPASAPRAPTRRPPAEPGAAPRPSTRSHRPRSPGPPRSR
jgi:hypothetical protein